MKQIIPIALFLTCVLGSPVAVDASMRPQGTKVLYYSSGVMERTFANHQNPRFKATGDYVPGLYRRKDANCLTAVSWKSRHLVQQNAVLVLDLYNPVKRVWLRVRCQASDWQQKRHATPYERYEVDYRTAQKAQFTRQGTTVARLVRIEQ